MNSIDFLWLRKSIGSNHKYQRKIAQSTCVDFSVDETTDTQGRYAANVLIGKLDKDFHEPCLVEVGFLEKTDSGTISRLVNEFLRFPWPDFDSTLLTVLVSDAAANMSKAG